MFAFHLTKRASHAVGVRIEPSRIQAVELRNSRGAIRIAHTVEIPLPEGAIVNGVITDRNAVTQGLRQAWKKGKFSTRNVIFSVDGASITAKDLGESDQSDSRTNGLAIQIASETLIDARLTPLATEAIPTALARTVQSLSPNHQAIAVVEVGSDVITVAVVGATGLQFTKSFANQGTDIAALTLESTFGITFDQARVRLYEISNDVDASIEWKRRTLEILHTWNRSVVSLVTDCIEEYAAETNGSPITAIALSGEGTKVAGIANYFESSFTCAVTTLDDYALTSALARTKGQSSSFVQSNLLPSSVREAVILLGIKRWILASFVMLGIASVAFWLYQQPQLNDLNHQLQLLRGGQ